MEFFFFLLGLLLLGFPIIAGFALVKTFRLDERLRRIEGRIAGLERVAAATPAVAPAPGPESPAVPISPAGEPEPEPANAYDAVTASHDSALSTVGQCSRVPSAHLACPKPLRQSFSTSYTLIVSVSAEAKCHSISEGVCATNRTYRSQEQANRSRPVLCRLSLLDSERLHGIGHRPLR